MKFANELQDKLGKHDPTQVDEIILDDLFTDINAFTDEHKQTLEKYNSLLHLSLGNFGLTNIKNFPKIKTLKTLELKNNKLDGTGLDSIKDLYPELEKLKISDNPIGSIDALKPFVFN